MSSMYKTFGTDESLEKSGIWLDYVDFKILVAYAGGANKAYQRSLENRTKTIRKAIQAGSIPGDKLIVILREVFADAVVLDWNSLDDFDGQWKQGIHNENGDIIPFTRENVVATFTKLPHLFANVQDAVNNAALFRKEELEDEAKNS